MSPTTLLRGLLFGAFAVTIGVGACSQPGAGSLACGEPAPSSERLARATAIPAGAAVVDLCNRLGMVTTGEGVETAAQFHHLAQLHCIEAQGYLFSHPLPADGFETSMQAAVL